MSTPRFTRRRFLPSLGRVGGLSLGAPSSVHAMSLRFPVSDHCDGHRFFNPGRQENRSWWDVLQWKRQSTPAAWPQSVAIDPPPLPAGPLDGTLAATWINHATVLVQTRHANILTDPIFSTRSSPVQWAGPKRVHPPGVALPALPPIHVILLSHDHFDHCDASTLRHFAAQTHPPIVVAPLGHTELLRSFGFPQERIIELDWWEAHEFAPGFHVRATPARHWSNRVVGTRNARLWSGFFVQAAGRTFYYTGDTAWDEDMFDQIHARCGEPDLAIIPIGAYEPRWFMSAQHCNPEEAVRIHQAVGALKSIGVHWGTFQLTDEGRDDPPTALTAALSEIGLPSTEFVVLAPGASVTG
jgi:L-ascorbate metabolism protein UlaG (beta-lactamase superfamily)